MAQGVSFYDVSTVEGGVLVEDIASPTGTGGTNVRGIWFDGVAFWVTTSQYLERWKLTGGSFDLTDQTDISGEIPNYLKLGPLVGDGEKLWISYERQTGGGPVTNFSQISSFTMRGKRVDDLRSSISATNGTYEGLTFNGRHLVACADNANVSNPDRDWSLFDINNDAVLTFAQKNTNTFGVSYDGEKLLCSNNRARFFYKNMDFTQVTGLLNAANVSQAKDSCYLHDLHFTRCRMNDFYGVQVAVIHNL